MKKEKVICNCAHTSQCYFAGGDECRHSEPHNKCDCDFLKEHQCYKMMLESEKGIVCCIICKEKTQDEKIQEQIKIVSQCLSDYEKEKKILKELME